MDKETEERERDLIELISMGRFKSNEERENLLSYSLLSMDMSGLTPMIKIISNVACETFRP